MASISLTIAKISNCACLRGFIHFRVFQGENAHCKDGNISQQPAAFREMYPGYFARSIFSCQAGSFSVFRGTMQPVRRKQVFVISNMALSLTDNETLFAMMHVPMSSAGGM